MAQIKFAIVKNSFLFTIINALPLLSSLVLLFFYTGKLSTSHYGELALYISISALSQVIIMLGFDQPIVKYFIEFKNDTNIQSKHISTIYASILISGFVFTLITLIIGPYLFSELESFRKLSFFHFGLFSVLTGVFNGCYKIFTNLLIANEKFTQLFLSNITNFFLTILFSLFGLYIYGDSVEGPLLGRLTSGVVIFLIATFFIIKRYGVKIDVLIFKKTIVVATPFLLMFVFNYFVSNSDRFILNDLLTLNEVAIYDISLKCCLGIDFVITGFSGVIIPKIYHEWGKNKNYISTSYVNKLYNSTTALTLILISANTLFLPLILPMFIHNNSYQEIYTYIPYLGLSNSFRILVMVYTTPLIYYNKTKYLPIIHVISGGLQTIFCYFLIKKFGTLGACFSLVISSPMVAYFTYLFCQKFIKQKFNYMKIIFFPLFYSLITILSELFLSVYINIHLVHLLQLLFCLVTTYLLFQKDINTLFEEKLSKLNLINK